MANFKLYYPKLQQNEGGYVNDPKDPGGETYAGVARNYWGSWPGWKRINPIVQGLTKKYEKGWPDAGKNRVISLFLKKDLVLQDMIFQFYKTNFWNSLQLDFVNSQALAEQLADHGVNAGAMRPAKMIQWLINERQLVATDKKLVVDGDIGPATIKAINAVHAPTLYKYFVGLRKSFYYYRANKLENASAVEETFFATQLNLRPKADQAKFLNSWLSRCVPATIPA